MSWAALVKSIKPEEAANFTAKPRATVFAVDPSQNDAERQLRNPHHETAEVKLPSFSKGLLILDANAIIKGMDNFVSTADALVTTPQVIVEIKDRASRDLLERLPHQVTVLDPTPEAVAAVVACAELTGDFGAMSRTDIRLCALALDCCKVGGFLGEPIEPRPPQVNPGNADKVQVMTEDMNEDGSNDEREKSEPAHAQSAWLGAMPGSDVQSGTRGAGRAFEAGMACVTSDYAMQNTLMHLGVPIVGTNGIHIRELRLWMMRCTACFTLVVDTTRQFCPECGSGDTLRRVNYVVNDQGEKKLYINFRKRISTRGTIYNLPKPRGGTRGTNRNLVLREDQLAHVIRGTTSSKVKAHQVMQNDDCALATFGEAPKLKKKNLADPRAYSSYHRYNVNEKKKVRAAHRK
ncbi:Nin one binding (NOB1) Zn-ribbon like family protein [Leishmania donovani]|uniref:Nin one binding (NOB1) Zn-ribbon like family protein n=1 Tax=Leishmania donovani TaxID=5661 RepID=A0A504XUC1_LEIDO|nr:Nin one binding (NOB1) Zn-ribbon like family protein [Leishmania donovani]